MTERDTGDTWERAAMKPQSETGSSGWGSGATRKHVHSVIRTPNGNDYGRELLRQHCLTSPHHR
ncbi:hypothetical protein HEP84_56745 [Streptomyces sp. RLB1-33]|uniref:hypothetical protein n=1 Tax=Streptomyces mirabilis TaxID=68239 RepID=UPI001B3C4D4F|nr:MULTISPECIES: hypothetical protein [Streptomyces]QUW85372.1 hypothetical protein SMIR_07570 [Streptomyces mirabilis]